MRSDVEGQIESRTNPLELPVERWQIPIIVGLGLDVLAGLVTAVVLSVADTPSRILIGITILVIITMAISVLLLFVRARRLSTQLNAVRSSLSVCETRNAK